jgi:hypothetical protein
MFKKDVSSFYVDYFRNSAYETPMKDRRPFTTSLETTLLKEIKKLAIDLDRPVNDLLEEAMKWLLKKYKKKPK